MKVVFDTNVLVAALAFPGGRGDAALQKIVKGEDSLALSKPILDELLSVLGRKFAHDRDALARVAVFLSELGDFVEETEPVAVLADEPDNRILECAVAADAERIVTGDRAMLALASYDDIRIISLREYLEL